MKISPELKAYQDAVWAYLVEHSDVTKEGAFFVKFHTKDRTSFEKHIKGRWKYDYHRIDTRTEETHIEKEKRAQATREFFASEKARKKQVWRANKQERARVFAELKHQNDPKNRKGTIHSAPDAAASIKVVLLRHICHVYTIAKNKVRALW